MSLKKGIKSDKNYIQHRMADSYDASQWWNGVFWQISIALIINILSLAFPIMMLQVYDRIIPNKSLDTLAILTFGVTIAVLLDGMLRITRSYLVNWLAISREHKTSTAAIRQWINAYLPDYQKVEAAKHLQSMDAIYRLREFFSGQTVTALADLPFIFVFLCFIAFLGGELVYIPLSLLVLFLFFSVIAGKRLKGCIKARGQADSKKFDLLIFTLAGVHTVKSQGYEMSILHRFEKRQQDVTKVSYFVAMASGHAVTLSTIFGQLSLILTATFGCVMAVSGELTLGGLSACTLLAGRTLQPLQRILGTWLRMQDYSIARKQVESSFSFIQHKRTHDLLPKPRGLLEVYNASFSYGNQKLLSNLNMRVEPGETVAIVAEKESGKSTLLKLLAGVLVPYDGNIQVDGVKPATHDMADLHAHIGYLPEEHAIFKGSLLDNLTGFDNSEATIDAAQKAAQNLGLDSIVNQLSNGYHTILSNSPSDPIPPGVKQRITLARVLKHEPSLLLIDDCDRSLDKEGYNSLFRTLGRLKGKTTIVMVSHDWNLLSLADKYYQLSNGTLVPLSLTNAQQLTEILQYSKEASA